MAEEQGSKKEGVAMAKGEGAVEPEVSLEGWSTRVEDMVDKGDEDGAVKLLERVIARLLMERNADSNLGLAAAKSDLGRLYASQGMSLKADKLLSDSLLIKTRAEGDSPVRDHDDGDLSWEDVAEESTSSKSGWKKGGASQATDYEPVQGSGTPSTAGVSDDDDWEAAVPSLLASPSVVPPAVKTKTPETVIKKETPKQKQRGRGAFTYGGGGNLYSDQSEEDRVANERRSGASTGAANDHWDGGAEHVLLIDGFSPLMQTKDLEDLLRPYSSKVSIRWIDDISAAAVFRTPALARQALAGIRDPRFKVHKYTEAGAGLGSSISLSLTDLEPPAPRPVTTARVAQRMIAGALSRQGVSSQNLRAKTKASAEQALVQEAERKQRLHNRQQLRDEAWGDD